MDTWWRLAWALPLVLLVGFAAVLILRRFVMRQRTPASPRPISMRDSLQLSADTRVHLIEVDGKPHLIVESTRPAVLHAALLQEGAPCPSLRFAPRWMQLNRGARR